MPQEEKVYVSLITDLLHAGYIRVIKEAVKYGRVSVKLLTQTVYAVNDVSYLCYEKRKIVC
jgi:phosphoenolpyruvate phosphomutase